MEAFGITRPSPEQSWLIFTRYGDRSVVQWSTLTKTLVPPGASTPTLSFRAVGLPAIVDAHVEGHYDAPVIDTLEDDSILAVDPLESNSVPTKVVGVEPKPVAATPANLTTRLETLTSQSCTLDWITQDGLCTTLRGHLTAEPARLTQFRDDLTSGHTPGGPVNDNAYWLLRVNADYIISLTPDQSSNTFFLTGSGPTANPPTLSLSSTVPTATTVRYKDSPSIAFSGGNPWKEVGTWTAAPASASGTLSTLGTAVVWLGLKNSDDIGTNYDLRVEVYRNATMVASGQTLCVEGITRNPDLAKQVTADFGAVTPASFNGTTDVLSLKVLTRIGTTAAGAFCGGHGNAIGLRLYFDAANRAALFDATF
jgi:hypothetical protein